MREILFRGKQIDNGEWVEGFLWKKKYNTNKIFISCFPDKDDNEEVFVVRPETIGQYTGLIDKNGNKIFEGDIIKLFLDDGIETGVIRYSETACRFMFYENNIMGYGFDNTCIFEIIGNIHDNPELLKESDNDE